jgi:hypothetical protein
MVSANQTATIVTITSPGPQGPQGPTGPPGGATTGSNTFTGDQTITGSILISGSIIPAVGAGQTTSSFDLGSETAAWRDIYVSEGSIKFIKSGSAEIVLSAKDGGISIDGGSTISADGVSGQFITSKSLGDNVTVKDSNNSLLMGPIEVETDKEIIIEEGSDLTIFGDIEIQNVATADAALFATSASYTDTSSFATTASYTLNLNPTFPYSGSAVITGSLVVNNGTNNVIDTSQYTLSDSSGQTALDWNQGLINYGGITALSLPSKIAIDNSGNESIDWSLRTLTDNSSTVSISWTNRLLNNSEGTPAIDYSDSSSLFLNTTTGLYSFTSASSNVIDSTPAGQGNVQIAFAQSGSNFYIYAHIGGRWRSASLF